MGNSHSITNKTAIFIDAQGNKRKVKLPVKAAELMLEEPGYVISPVEQIRLSRRIAAMRADDELLAGKVYMLVPLGRVHSKVTQAELATLEAICLKRSPKKTKNQKKQRRSKVLPAEPEELPEERATQIKALEPQDTSFPCRRSRMNCRQWIPVLEPIYEVS